MKLHRNHNKRTTKKGGKRHSSRNHGTQHGGLSSTVVQPSKSVPSSILETAVFQESGFLTSAGTSAARQWTPNSFYDCQPAVSGNKWNKYDQWAGLFTEYRVVSYKYKFELSNTEGGNYPFQYYILQTDANPGTTVATYVELAAQRYCTSGQAVINQVVVKGGASVDALIGERSPDYADSYKALMTADPTDKVWLSLGVSFSNSVSNNGVMYRLTITAKIRLFAPTITTQFYLDRPSGLQLEAERLAFKHFKAIKYQKENEEREERYLAAAKVRKALLQSMVDKEIKRLESSQK